jgi:ankyrin repeat protein
MVSLMLQNPYLNLTEVGLNGINAAWIAVYSNQLGILKLIETTSAERSHPIDLLAKNKEGINPLHLASYYNNIDIAMYLADDDQHYDVNAVTMNGYSPLCVATIRQNNEII